MIRNGSTKVRNKYGFSRLFIFKSLVLPRFPRFALYLMRIFQEVSPLKNYLNHQRSQGKSIGLVPTMGALHKGHLALLQEAKHQNDLVICSIYVNPIQFNNRSDFKKYPRDLEDDYKTLRSWDCDVSFVPSDKDIYPNPPTIHLNFGNFENQMEATHRPGHFNGVGLVVIKLLNLLQPNTAYFGQKDWQQYIIIRQLVKELFIEVEVKWVSTQREPNGLAVSSRNKRLTQVQKDRANIFYQALKAAQTGLLAGRSVNETAKDINKMIEDHPGIELEYFTVVDSQTLQSVSDISKHSQVSLCIAGYVGEIRLIDNIFLFPSTNTLF